VKEWLPKGIHHLWLGHIDTFLSIIAVGIDAFFIHSWTMLWICSGTSLFGQVYALDDLIGEYFHISTPFKKIDRWLKKHWAFYFEICFKLDKLFGKEK
jgi:hypothetical protein